jgi:enterochelin esterase-like enzyme
LADAGLVTETLDYDGGRQVTVYAPPKPAEAVVFVGDGGWHTPGFVERAKAVDLPPLMIVGVHGLDDDEGRLKEYVPGFDADRFDAFEEFFVGDVREWVRSRFGVALLPERTAVWGASLGGELALAMAMRHPEIYGIALCASPGGGFRPTATMPSSLPRVYLVAGRQEPFFLENATRWADALREVNADVVIEEREGEHGGAFWGEEIPLMLTWAFGPSAK